MKKLLLLLLAMVVYSSLPAQTNETELLGKWQVTEYSGDYDGTHVIFDNAYIKPYSLSFFDDGTYYIEWLQWDGVVFGNYGYGFWITHTPDTYALHLQTYQPTDIGNLPKVRTFVFNPAGSAFILQNLKRTGSMKFENVNDNGAGIADVKADTQNAANGTYSINGIKVDHIAAPGIYVVDGEKVLVK